MGLFGRKNTNVDFDENINYGALEQHTYKDSPGQIFYTCPVCGGEYLASFITEDAGETMCVECWDERFG